MINQLNMHGQSKVRVAIERIKLFEPPEGYYLAFSGGKDSITIKALADMAGVKYDAHYSHTSVDPPELIYYIRQYHPDVTFEYPRYKNGERITMWNLIPKNKMPPTRMVRYCCNKLKEGGGEGRVVITGVRWAESAGRKKNRAGLEIATTNKTKRVHADPDNPDNEVLTRICPTKGKTILNPIIDWDDSEVWEFIKSYNLPYCTLYDNGFKRIGCMGCPLSKNNKKELEAYPKFKQAYLRAFEKMLAEREKAGLQTDKWNSAEDVMTWWLN